MRVYDIQQQLAVLDDDILDRFGVDTIELGRGFALSDEAWADWSLPDGTPCQVPGARAAPERSADGWVIRSRTGRVIAAMPDGALYFESTLIIPSPRARRTMTVWKRPWPNACGTSPPPVAPLAQGPTATR